MPYNSADDKSLPQYVKNKTSSVRKKWVAIFNRVYKEEGEEVAFIVANKWLKKQKQPIKRSIVTFEADTSGEFIKRSDDGEDYITLKLGSSNKHGDGKQYSETLLKKWADWINSGNMITGDGDHEFYDKVMSGYYTDEQIKHLLKSKSGIAKGIKAMFDKGTLYLRALIDKRYRNKIEQAKGVSAEAFVSYGEDGTIEDGDLLGFTFNFHTSPADPGAGVLA